MSSVVNRPSFFPRYSIGLVAIAAAGFVAPAWQRSLWNPDEPRVAHIGQSMALAGGDWLVPRVNGEPHIQEPPLYHWLTAASFRLLGTQAGREWVPRVPSILFALATFVLVAREATRWGGIRSGLLAALVLATTAEFLEVSNRTGVDGALAFFVLWGGSAILRIAVEPKPGAARFVSLGAAAALAFLTKNLLGPSFLVLMLTAAMVSRRDLIQLPGVWARLGLGAAVFFMLAAPWIVVLWRRDPALARSLLFDHTLGRFMADGLKNPGRLEFCGRVLADGLPWTPFLFVAVCAAGKKVWRPGTSDPVVGRPLLRALIAWILLPAILVFASGSRRNLYLLSIWPGAAILLGLQLDRWFDRPVSRPAAIATILLAAPLPLAAAFGGLWVQPMPFVVFVCLVVHLFFLYLWARRKGWRIAEESLLTAAVLVGLAMAGGNLMRFKFLDARESYAPLGEDLRLLGREGFEIAAFDLDLRELGAVCYQLETRSIRHLRTADEAAEILTVAGPPIALVARERSLPEDAPAPLREPTGSFSRSVGGREIVVLLNRLVPAGVRAISTSPSPSSPLDRDRPK